MFAPWGHCVDAVPAQGGPPASVRIGLAPWAGHSLGSALSSPPATCCTQTPAQTAAAAHGIAACAACSRAGGAPQRPRKQLLSAAWRAPRQCHIMIVRRPLRPPLSRGGFISPGTAHGCAATRSMCSSVDVHCTNLHGSSHDAVSWTTQYHHREVTRATRPLWPVNTTRRARGELCPFHREAHHVCACRRVGTGVHG